jgi:hypothetical protein
MQSKTLKQLVDEWLEKFPEDKDDPNLIENITAGMIELSCGTYVNESYYDMIIKLRGPQLPKGNTSCE